MTRLNLQSLNLARDAKEVLRWPPPDQAAIDGLSFAEFEEDFRVLLNAGMDLALGRVPFGVDEQTSSGIWLPALTVEAGGREEVESGLFLQVGHYLAAYCDRMVRRNQRLADRLFSMEQLEEFVDAQQDCDLTAEQRERSDLLVGYLALVPVTATLGRITRPEFDAYSSASVHLMLATLFRASREAKQPSIRELGALLAGSVIQHLEWVYRAVLESYSEVSKLGLSKHLRGHELALMAKRDPLMINKYGATILARVYEEQLALAIQSFGFHVARSKSGKSTVDLICISSDPRMAFMLLLEAKSCARPYALPKRDQRALEDYVEDVTSTLTTLPPLRLVLVVGPDGTRTLAEKLRMLSNSIGCPVRFLPAWALVRLRNQIVGPLPMRDFLNEALASKPILDDSFVDAVVSAAATSSAAHNEFVERILR